jgi:hypothetical protein
VQELAREASALGARPLNLALAWASIGDADHALACLTRDSLQVWWAPHAIWWDPRFESIRRDRRFMRVRDRVEQTWRTVIVPLPFCANSGRQRSAAAARWATMSARDLDLVARRAFPAGLLRSWSQPQTR